MEVGRGSSINPSLRMRTTTQASSPAQGSLFQNYQNQYHNCFYDFENSFKQQKCLSISTSTSICMPFKQPKSQALRYRASENPQRRREPATKAPPIPWWRFGQDDMPGRCFWGIRWEEVYSTWGVYNVIQANLVGCSLQYLACL